MAKMKPFAFLGYDKKGEPIIVELDRRIKAKSLPGNPSPIIGKNYPPGKVGKDATHEMSVIANNPTWIHVGTRWYRIG